MALALALVDGRLTAAEAMTLATLDEAHQMEVWGKDREALERQALIAADLEAAARFIALLSQD
jgi:chaperone required for assembly of F1-ATPase